MKQLTSLIIAIFMFVNVHAQEHSADGGQFCYLPTQSNVTYSSVQELPVSSPNEVLNYGEKPFQFGELWLPATNNSEMAELRHPLIVLIHGGCWLNSFDIRHTHALSTALVQSGYAVWSVEYRRTGDDGGGWPGSFNDIKEAIEYIPRLESHPIELNQVAIAGHSAGGHLALLAGANELYDFSAVIGLAAIVDLEKYSQGSNSCQLATPQFMGGTIDEIPEAYKTANPAKLSLHKSTILLHGDSDAIVPIEHTRSTTAHSRIIEGAGHFDMLHPGTRSFRALLQELAKAFSKKAS